jgi:hypothetical protein
MEEVYDAHKEYKIDAEKGWCRRNARLRFERSLVKNRIHWNAGVVRSPHFGDPVGLHNASFLL